MSSLVGIPCPQTNNTDRPKMYQRSVRVITPGGVPGVVKCHPYPARPMQLTHYSGRKSIVPMVIYLPTTLCASIEFDDSIANLNIAFLFIPHVQGLASDLWLTLMKYIVENFIVFMPVL